MQLSGAAGCGSRKHLRALASMLVVGCKGDRDSSLKLHGCSSEKDYFSVYSYTPGLAARPGHGGVERVLALFWNFILPSGTLTALFLRAAELDLVLFA